MKYGITGHILQMIKQMNTDTSNILKINDMFTDKFVSKYGVKQDDNLSPNNFCLFINKLIKDLKACNKGVVLNENTRLSTLAYTDDIVIIASNQHDLQIMLNKLSEWCKQWHVLVNTEKTKLCISRKKVVQM